MKIAVFGAHINSTNLGCQALTYSLLNLLNEIECENQDDFEYHIFEYFPDEEKKQKMCERLGIDDRKLNIYKVSPIYRMRSYIKHGLENMRMLRAIKSCDIAIDLTAGDSFSDIYGKARFYSLTKIKRIVQKLGVPLMLGPQTYGPFEDKKCETLATKVFLNSEECIARDMLSADLVEKLTGKKIEYTTDLAFQLPYVAQCKSTEKKVIGINISALLVQDAVEKGFAASEKLKTDYDKLIDDLVRYLATKEEYRICLISHVGEDYLPCKNVAEKYSNVEVAPLFDDPISIKNFISSMDVFIGSRMHATVASFTAGIPTIPLAYSRKFKGLFDVVGYEYVVDLQILNTQEAFDRIIEYIKDLERIEKDVQLALEKKEEFGNKTKKCFENFIYKNKEVNEL